MLVCFSTWETEIGTSWIDGQPGPQGDLAYNPHNLIYVLQSYTSCDEALWPKATWAGYISQITVRWRKPIQEFKPPENLEVEGRGHGETLLTGLFLKACSTYFHCRTPDHLPRGGTQWAVPFRITHWSLTGLPPFGGFFFFSVEAPPLRWL